MWTLDLLASAKETGNVSGQIGLPVRQQRPPDESTDSACPVCAEGDGERPRVATA